MAIVEQLVKAFSLGPRLLFRSVKDWQRPKRKKVLIFDARTGQPLLNYIDPEHVSLLYQWQERVNVLVCLKCILSLNLTWLGYAKQYIDAVGPSVVITLTDNSITFYELKTLCRDVVTISVQLSWRGEETDIFHVLKTREQKTKLEVDYVLTYNREIGQLYQRYVGGEVIPIGSLINNHFQQTRGVRGNALVFISEFRPLGAHATDALKTRGGKQATWEDIYSLERILLPFLAEYCEQKGISLSICGAKNRDQAEELDFYRKLLGERKWQWIPRRDWFSNYGVINDADFVVFINSTLGYESLARGKRVACLSARGNWFQDARGWRFGWPSDFPDDGAFWTNRADVVEFRRVMDYVTSVSDVDWMEAWRHIGPRLMVYDPGNSRLISLLRTLGVPVKVDNQSVPVLKAVRS